MNYEARQSKESAARDTLAQVIDLGEAAGTFTAQAARHRDEDTVYGWNVTTPSGTRFWLSANGWRNEGKIHASVTDITSADKTIKVQPSDVAEWVNGGREAAPSASVSHERGAAIVLRELVRRMFTNEQAQAIGQRQRERLAKQEQSRGGLRAHIATLEKLGYDFRNVSASEAYNATGYKAGAPMVKVYADGKVSFDAHCSVEKFAAIVAQMKD